MEKKLWSLPVGTIVRSRDGNLGEVVMETGHGTVVITWKKHGDRFVYSEKELKSFGITVWA